MSTGLRAPALAPAAPIDEAPGDALCIELIRRELSTRSVGFTMHLFDALSSTTEVACRLAQEGARAGVVVLAETQRSGRRRFGRPWFPPERENLYASVVFRPPIAPAAVPVFALIASLALADAGAAEGADTAVRWPNDVVVGGRRVGGTLVSAAVAGDSVQHVVLGVDVSLNLTRDALRRTRGWSAAFMTSLREAAGHAIDRNRFAAALLNRLERWADFYAEGGAAGVLAAWNQRDAVRGHAVEVRAADGTHRGHAAGLDTDGRLLLEQRSGRPRIVASGEIILVDGERIR